MRTYFGLFGTFPPEEDCPAARAELIEANDRCIEGLAFAIGKATRNDAESPIVRATVAPKCQMSQYDIGFDSYLERCQRTTGRRSNR